MAGTGRGADRASVAGATGLTASEGLALASSALRLAFSWISFCLAGSLAMIETRSDGTGV